MLWLLPYIAWTVGASAVVGAAGYAAVTHFAVVQRILVAVVQRNLRRITDDGEDGAPSYHVERTKTGLVVTGIRVSSGVLEATELEGNQLRAVAVARLEFDFPSLTRPVTIRVHGVDARLEQLRLPKAVPAAYVAADEKAQRDEDRGHELAAVEQLLWGAPRDAPKRPSRWNPAGRYVDHLQAQALRKTLAFLVQYVHLEVEDVAVQYMQYGEPGPRPTRGYLQGADAAVLSMRSVVLQPQGRAGLAVAPEGEEGGGGKEGGGAAPPPPTDAASAAAAVKAAAAEAEDQPWWQALLHLPQLLWSNVVTSKPSATKLTASGINLTLQTWPATWHGFHEAKRATDAAAGPAPFTFSPGKAPGGAVGGDDGLARKRRRPVTARRVAFSGVSGPQQPARPAAGPAPAPLPAYVDGDGPPDLDALLQGRAPEEHVVFRQWEFTVVACLLPPGYRLRERMAPRGGAAPAAPAPGMSEAFSLDREDTDASELQASETMEYDEGPADLGPLLTPDLRRSSMLPEPVTVVDRGELLSGARPLGRPSSRRVTVRSPAEETIPEAGPAGAAGPPSPFAANGDGPFAQEKTPAASPSRRGGKEGEETPGAVSPRGSVSSHAAPVGGTSLLDVAVTMKALVPTFNVASTAIVNRMVDRQQHHEHFGPHWRRRPQVPVAAHSALWWQHAGGAVATEVRRVHRRQTKLSQLAQRRAHRLEYQALYAASHVSTPGFQEPGRRWWQRRGVRAAAQEDVRRLEALEETLSTEEVAHFRFGVAVTHNVHLATDGQLLHFVADKIDAIVFNRGGVSLDTLEQLLHHDEEEIIEDTSPLDGHSFGLMLSIDCPKLGIALDMRPSSGQEVEGGPEERVPYVVLALHRMSLELNTEGVISLLVSSLEVGRCDAPTAPITPKIVSSPSTVCQSVCKAAEFFRYAVTGSLLSDSAASQFSGGEPAFLRMTMAARPGRGGLTVGEKAAPEPEGASLPAQGLQRWHPGGHDLSVAVAVVGVRYEQPMYGALLRFLDAWDNCKFTPWSWETPAATAAAPAAAAAVAAAAGPSVPAPPAANRAPVCPKTWPALPPRPLTVADMVLQSFVRNDRAMLGEVTLPGSHFELTCPGVAVQLPYHHRLHLHRLRPTAMDDLSTVLGQPGAKAPPGAAAAGTPGRSQGPPTPGVTAGMVPPGASRRSSSGGDGISSSGSRSTQKYNFVMAVQNIRLIVGAENVGETLQSGVVRRLDATAMLDIFSYLSNESRQAVARHLTLPGVAGPSDPARRLLGSSQSFQESASLEERLQEVEITAMAKVWAYPEDMQAIMQGIKSQNHQHALSKSFKRHLDAISANQEEVMNRRMGGDGAGGGPGAAGSAARGSSSGGADSGAARATADPALYPMPLVPFLKCAPVRANLAERLSPSPELPGEAELALACSILGCQTWFSPLHVWHLMSLERAVRQILDFLLTSAATTTAETAEEAADKEARKVARREEGLKEGRQCRRFMLSLGIAEISVLWMIGTWIPKGAPTKGQAATSAAAGAQRGGVPPPGFRRQWGITVKPSDPAYLWAQWLAPVYSISMATIRVVCRRGGDGLVEAALSLDGILARDLQLPENARHAYVLRPLPARARRLNAWVNDLRLNFLGIKPRSRAHMLWMRGLQAIILRKRTALRRQDWAAGTRNLAIDCARSSLTSALYGGAWYGPQVQVSFSSGPSQPADLSVEVGQLLAYVRIKEQASMTAFATQLAQIAQTINRGPAPAASTAPQAPSAAPAVAARSTAQAPLRVSVRLVGIDVLFRVQSNDLMAAKLVHSTVTIDRPRLAAGAAPGAVRLAIAASVDDIFVQDLRAGPEHHVVLSPHGEAESCSLAIDFTAYADSTKAAPTLALALQNPRILLLFRFVSDILQAVNIINSAATRTKTASAGGGTPSGLPNSAGAASAAAAAADALPSSGGSGLAPKELSLKVVVQLTNVGILLPTHIASCTVLGAQMDKLTLALPGRAMPNKEIRDSGLPSVDRMIEESLLSTKTFRYSKAFTAAGGPAAAGGAPKQAMPAGGNAEGTARPHATAKPAPTAMSRAKELGAKVRDAVAMEAAGATPLVKRPARPSRRDDANPAGVLYLGAEAQGPAERAWDGVLQLESGDWVGARGQGEEEVAEGSHFRPLPALRDAGRAIGNFANSAGESIQEVFDGDGLNRELLLPSIARLAEAAAAGRPDNEDTGSITDEEEDSGSEEGDGGSGEREVVPFVLGAKARHSREPRTGPPPPAAVVALCAERFRVLKGELVKVPNYFCRRAGGGLSFRPPGGMTTGSFAPPSLGSFSWPWDMWDLLSGESFIQPCSLALVQFAAGAVPHPQLHFCATSLSGTINAPNFAALMDFVSGNLGDLWPEEKVAGVAAAAAAAAEGAVPRQFNFNPAMKFGPQQGVSPTFRLTVAVPRLAVVLEAHPREWSHPQPTYSWVGEEMMSLRPFLRAVACNVMFDLGNMPGGDRYMNLVTTSLDVEDLRLAYRLDEVSQSVQEPNPSMDATSSGWRPDASSEEEEETMGTPRSRNSEGTRVASASERGSASLGLPRMGGPGGGALSGLPPGPRAALQREGRLSSANPSPALSEDHFSDAVSEVGSDWSGVSSLASLPPAAAPRGRHRRNVSSMSHLSSEPPGETPGSPPSPAGDDGDEEEQALEFSFSRGGVTAPRTLSRLATPGMLQVDSSGTGGSGAHGAPTPVAGGEGVFTPMGDGNPHTGIKLEVARRLSQQPGRRRSLSAVPESGGGAAAGQGPTPGATPGRGHAASDRYLPVIDFAAEAGDLTLPPNPEPGAAAVLNVITAPHRTAFEESAQYSATGIQGTNANIKLEVTLGFLADGTRAVEVTLANGLVNWPYFTDLSVVWCVSNVFMSAWSPARAAGDPSAPAAVQRPAPPAPLLGPSPWQYFNVVLAQTEIFIPVFDVAAAQGLAEQLWDWEVEGVGKSEFHRVADLALAQMVLEQLDDNGNALSLEERGLVVSSTALRVSYAHGGDGETDFRVDLRELAGFVRDPGARVNCFLLPLSCTVALRRVVPQAAEAGEVERLHAAAATIQRAWRRYRIATALRAAGKSDSAIKAAQHLVTSSGMGSPVPKGAAPKKNLEALMDGIEGGPRLGTYADMQSRPWQVVDNLVMEVASPHTNRLLAEYKRQSAEKSQLIYLQQFRATSTTVLRVEAGTLTARAAFSHIPFWQDLVDAAQRMVLAAPGDGATTAAGPPATEAPGSADASSSSLSEGFRPHSLQVTAAIQSLTALLCNDKPEAFGAPDVLQCSLATVDLGYDMATLLPDRPPNKAARLGVSSYASFLNSGTSRWEPLYDSWPVQAEFVDIVSPLYLSDRKTNLWLTSQQHLELNFNPASLLSIGDALAFSRAVHGVAVGGRLQRGDGSLTRKESDADVTATVRKLGAAGALRTALPTATANSGAVSAVLERAPQKYLIQNQSGMKVFYWVDLTLANTPRRGRDAPAAAADAAGGRRSPVYCLENGESESLKVVPATKRLNIVQLTNAGTGAERMGNMINLHFEGNWMPIRDVAVNVLGKYRYRMTSPADNTSVPVIIDIILVGRTKIITLHSGVYVENAIDREISFRLHIPTTPLVPPPSAAAASGRGSRDDGDCAVMVGPLAPGTGCYLPLTAVLGGSLFLRAEGFMEAQRDVIRLTPALSSLSGQQGYLTCEAAPLGRQRSALHVALQAVPAKLVSEFQSFKHMECVAPGRIERASDPLEMTLSIQPTLVLHNALPYEMRVLLWQVSPAAEQSGAGPQPRTSVVPGIARGSPGHVNIPLTQEEDYASASTWGHAGDLVRETATEGPRPAGAPASNMGQALFGLISPRLSMAVPRKGTPGRYLIYSIKPGGSQDVYVDLRQNVLLHVSVEEIGMRSTKWALCSWNQRAAPRADGTDVHHLQRLPKEIPLRMVGLGMSLPMEPHQVAKYLLRLKDAALHLRTVHYQFHHDAKAAVNSEDINAAVGRVRAFARKMTKASAGAVNRMRSPRRRPQRAQQRRGSGAEVELASRGGNAPAAGRASQIPLLDVRAGAGGTPLAQGVDVTEGGAPRPPSPFASPRQPGPPASGVAPSVAPSPSQASDRGLLTDVPLSSPAPAPAASAAAAGVRATSSAGGGVRKPKRSSLFMQCFNREDRSKSSPAAAQTTVTAVPATPGSAGPSSVAASSPAVSPSPGRKLLGGRWSRSDAPPVVAPGGVHRPPSPIEGLTTLGLEAVPEAAASSSSPEAEERRKEVLRTGFSSWRDVSAATRAKRVTAEAEAMAAADLMAPVDVGTAEEESGEEAVQVRTPPLMFLGVHNSLTDTETPAGGSCRLTLFSPYWLNNRTGVDLFYKDHTSAPGNPILLGAPLPWDFGEVFTPGTSITELAGAVRDAASEAGSSVPWGSQDGGGGGDLSQALIEYKLVLMNKQDEVRMGLAHVPHRSYAGGIKVKTVGNKGTVELKGPAAEVESTADAVLRGLRAAPAAVAQVLMGGEAGSFQGAAAFRGDDDDGGLQTAPSSGTAAPPEEPAPAAPPGGRQLLGLGGPLTSRGSQIPGSPMRHLRRSSVDATGSINVVAKQPGTMLVRLTSTATRSDRTPPQRSTRGSSSAPHAGGGLTPVGSGVLQTQSSFDRAVTVGAEVEAAVREMAEQAEAQTEALPISEDSRGLSQAMAHPEGIASAELRDAVAAEDLDGGEEAAAASALPSSAAAGAALRQEGAPPPCGRVARASALLPRSDVSLSTQARLMQPEEQTPEAVEEYLRTMRKKKAAVRARLRGQRVFEFATDVAAGPPDSIFRHTKLVTLKPKYLIENQTGMPVAVKQLGTADPPEHTAAASARFSRVLQHNERAAVYWDESELPREIVVRIMPPGEEGSWHWSGGFPIPENEWYFGLRIRHRASKPSRSWNIPINVTVGSSGSVQVTLKSPNSVPPYRVVNSCKDVVVQLIQAPLIARKKKEEYYDYLAPGEGTPYAWDEPTLPNKLQVRAALVGKASESRMGTYALDHLGDQAMMLLPTHGGKGSMAQRSFYRALAPELPDELKQKLVSLLAAEFSKKVYVTVFADGPTRVLRFSDEKNLSSLEQQHVTLDLAARLRQVEGQLREVSARFARLDGSAGAHALDLYGRNTLQREPDPAAAAPVARKASRRQQLNESAQVLVRHASLRMPSGQPMGGLVSRTVSVARLGGMQQAQQEGGERQQATVRFDIPSSQPSGSGARSPERRRGSPTRLGRQGEGPSSSSGVLQVPADPWEERMQPYRRLMVRTGSASSIDAIVDAAEGSGHGMPRAASLSEEIQPGEDFPPPLAVAGPSGAVRRAPSGRDWGHITPSTGLAAGTRTMMVGTASKPHKSGPGGGLGPSGSGTAAATAPIEEQRRQDKLRGMAEGDAVLLIGGDLNVTVVQAQGLVGGKTINCFARVHVKEPFPTTLDEERAKQTSVIWQSAEPVWDEQLGFRDVCAAAELAVELWDLGGTRSSAQLQRLTANPSEVIKSCRFLGRAEVALGQTLDVPAGTPLWFPLMRRGSADAVSGQLQLRFVWDVTARGLLTIKLAALERVLAQRREILAALQPVSSEEVLAWMRPPEPATPTGSGGKADGGMMGAGVSLFGVDTELGMVGAGGGWPLRPSQVATEVLARHAHDHNKRNLAVTVLEARGLHPRKGVVVALSASELPCPVVTLSVPGYPAYETPVAEHGLNPRWDANQRHEFRGADPSAAAVTVRLCDRHSGLHLPGRGTRVLGEATIHAAHIKGEKPVYVWVPLASPKRARRSGGAAAVLESEELLGEGGLAVYLRVQWQSVAVRGASMKVEAELAGAGLLVMGGLQDELFNITLDSMRGSAVSSRLQLTVEGEVRKVQLDNQMLDAIQPVVLAPAANYHAAGTLRGAEEPPLITFNYVRSYAGSGEVDEQEMNSLTHMRGAAGAGAGSLPGSPTAQSSAEKAQSIKSFKDIRLNIGNLDLMTDEAFLEALMSFVNSVPTADIWQDRAWQDQQRRLLTAQFGPKEVESLAVNAVIPSAPASLLGDDDVSGGDGGGGEALQWVVAKEARDLEVLHGQSDFSSWFFIESAEVGMVVINVTVSLSSQLLTSATRSSATTHGGTFNRVLGASGFQLVNVGNVPIVLGKWMVGNDPSIRGKYANGFLSQKALRANLTRHYTREALKEAHKVLGGAGPAVASVPLTMLWASGSAFTLLRSISTGTTGPVAAVQQVFYVPLMSMSMLVTGFSRMLAALLALVPPDRPGGDDATVQRIVKRPPNALEALMDVPREVVWGFYNAVSGVMLDPVAGWQSSGVQGLLLGLIKATLGLVGRPAVGVLEGTSKAMQAAALACLGREGIVGKIQRRVKAPGAFSDDGTEGLEEGPRSEAQLHVRALMAAWQRVLPEFFPALADDTVTDVINVRSTRVILITDRHVAYLRARHMRRNSIYRAKWLLPISEVQNLTGSSESLKIYLTHVHKYDLWLLGVWPVQKRKALRCGSRTVYERTVMKLSRLLQAGRAGPTEEEGRQRFIGADMRELTILSAPYTAPQGPSRQVLALPAPP